MLDEDPTVAAVKDAARPSTMSEMVRIAAKASGKEDAIRQAGQLLVAAGCVAPGYEESMIARESVANTYLGAGVAIPHGLGEDKGLVRRDGVVVLQFVEGIEWNPGQIAHLVVGIAANSDSHITILRRLTRLIQDEERLKQLATTTDAGLIAQALQDDVAPAAAPREAAQDLPETIGWVVDYPTGLHARPASAWVEAAKASDASLRVRHGDETADPRSLIALLQLGLKAGDEVVLSAGGKGARVALQAFHATVTRLTSREKADAARAAEKAAQNTAGLVHGWAPPGTPQMIGGVAASPGLAIGRVHVLASADLQVPDAPVDLAMGGALLNDALLRTRAQMSALIDDTTRRLGAGEAAIFKAQATLLDDTDLITLTCQMMVEGHGVAWSWHQAVERMAGQLSALGNPVLAARAADLQDVGRRVLAQIDPGLGIGTLADLPPAPCILVAGDLSPSDTAVLDTEKVVGIATVLGGPTSHSAILARTLGIPSVVAGGAQLLSLAAGATAIVDGDAGRVWLNPSQADLDSARDWIAARETQRIAQEAERSRPADTTDGISIAIGANINRPDQAAFALAQGGEGVGLMRTEFLFLEAGETPGEDEQFAIYRGMIEALGDRPLIVRTLDIGGDKQVAHLDLPKEENPFLGVRGARLLLRRPDLLDPQLRALYRAAALGGDLSIMFPMITSVPELITLRARCEAIRAELDAPHVPIGIMIEVPAAAVVSHALAEHADFFSVGTNDLTQYTLAIDRQNPDLASEADSLHPAVLRLIAMTVEGAKAHGRWVGVCGGLAGDPFGAALLAGLGVTELSMTPRDIPAVKARIRASAMADLQALAARALAVGTAADVRALNTGAL
jgi:phosphocarrier protein FPr